MGVSSRIGPSCARGRPLQGVIACLVVTMMLAPPAGGDVSNQYVTVDIVEGPEWRETGGGGQDLGLDFHPGGSRLLLVGYGAPGEVRVTDTELGTVAVIDLPEEDLEVRGALWSSGKGRVLVWGSSPGEANDSLLVYVPPHYTLNTTMVPREEVPLARIDAARFLAGDRILAVAGRDVNGTSRLLILEVGPFRLHRSYDFPGNATVVSIGTDNRTMLVLDDGGHLRPYRTTDWSPDGDPIELGDVPTASSYVIVGTWAVGDASGQLTLVDGLRTDRRATLALGMGPVQAVSYGHSEESAFLVAIPGEDGGSVLQVIQLREWEGPLEARSEKAISAPGEVTSMAVDPATPGGVLVGFADGSLRRYLLVLGPKPGDTRGLGDFILPALLLLAAVVVLIAAVRYLRARKPPEGG
jgi:hypothetical protein